MIAAAIIITCEYRKYLKIERDSFYNLNLSDRYYR